jgi:hypothetical protein
MTVPEARLEHSEYGLVAATDGRFVVNVRDAAWVTNASPSKMQAAPN